jgi:hypothetical protein
MTGSRLTNFANARDELLARLVEELAAEPQFIAAWLTGSFGRSAADAISDLDLNIVLSAEAAESLCVSPWRSAGQTTPARLALFSRFGRPVIVYEAHDNAPTPGGTMTTVIYDSGLIVDWFLLPQAEARQPARARLLFARQPIPPAALPLAEGPIERGRRASHQLGYFWMMAAIIVKWIVRGNAVEVNNWLATLGWLVEDVRRLLAGEPEVFRPRPAFSLKLLPAEQAAALRALCREMSALMPLVAELGGYVPKEPMAAVEARLALIEEGDA